MNSGHIFALFMLLLSIVFLWDDTKQFHILCKPNQEEIQCTVEERPIYGLFSGSLKTISAKPTAVELSEKKARKTFDIFYQLYWITPTEKLPLAERIVNSEQEVTAAKKRLEDLLIKPSPTQITIQAGRDSWLAWFLSFFCLLMAWLVLPVRAPKPKTKT